MINRNARARLGAKIRADSSLSHATRNVANAVLFAVMSARSGRCQASRARLAHEAGCSERTVTRATKDLEATGYLRVVPTWSARRRQLGGRWFRPRGPNVLEWVLPAGFFLNDRMSRDPSPRITISSPTPLSEGLARVLTRFGNAIADRAGLPAPS